ncbi:MAG TPA: hypothetical protein DC038_08995 [Clostridiales bacterium]|nr:hypothetical protein [Clostridiales bacterium]
MNLNYNQNYLNIYDRCCSNNAYLKHYCGYNISMSEVPVSNAVGYIDLYIFTDRAKEPVEGAKVVFYARKGDVNTVPVKEVITEKIPTKVELPVANPSGTLINGPEYYYTSYNMTIEKEGYYSITVLNIRIFPDITTQFTFNLNPVIPGVPGKQETISIPSHPRDMVKSKKVKQLNN